MSQNETPAIDASRKFTEDQQRRAVFLKVFEGLSYKDVSNLDEFDCGHMTIHNIVDQYTEQDADGAIELSILAEYSEDEEIRQDAADELAEMGYEVPEPDESALEDGNDTISLEEAISRANPALEESLQRISDALESAADHYSAEVLFKYTCKNTSMVRISSSENYWNEGELGINRFRIVLGNRGGLQTAEWHDEFTGTTRDLREGTKVRYAWSRLTDRIADAD